MIDIYFTPEYGKLYEKVEVGTCQTFDFTCSYGQIRYMFILREIPQLVDNIKYFDIITPYGYGGPAILNCNDREKLIAAYEKQFAKYCNVNKIVSEFVRFHPILNNHVDFQKLFEVSFNRKTVSIDLTNNDIFMTELVPECRNKIRKAENKGVQVSIDFKGETIEAFYKLYLDTMKKNDAVDYYYFPFEYFQQLLKSLGNSFIIVNSHFEGKIVASAIFLFSDKYLHYHLAATNPNYYKIAANNAFIWKAITWGKERGLQKLHLGGGLSSSEDDNLYKFKKGFSKGNNTEFYIGKRIHNQEVYECLVDIRKRDSIFDKETNFFPTYRG